MDVMYQVRPIFGAEEIPLPSNMYYVKPIGFDSTDLTGFSIDKPTGDGNYQSGSKSSLLPANQSKTVEQAGKENKPLNNEKTTSTSKPTKETEDHQKHGKKSKKGKNSGSGQGQENAPSKDDGQSSKDEKKDQKEDDRGGLVPFVVDVPYLGNIIGDVVVRDIAIQADFDYKPLRVLKVINHLRKNFGLKIAVKVHISSTVLVETETNVDEWKMFETFESTILPRQDNQLFVSLIVKRFTIKEAWLNKQPFMILDPLLSTAIYGEVNIARHITRLASKHCPPICEIYPEDDPNQSETVKDIDETLNEIQKFLFVRDLQDKQARPSIPELADKRLKDNSDLDLKLTLDYILLLSLKL